MLKRAKIFALTKTSFGAELVRCYTVARGAWRAFRRCLIRRSTQDQR
ncbi:hypothetical protein F441_21625 [Phytophthora nicotianae CJ01A1]|uniref:Uncharacterized protein n=4 Tax=Phytophthora nicotianae TaxID=4792 RepID=V9DWK4_PHYNI|nr:hypothetical protein F443_21737 [Phytophthora nicotianae P1569]ETO59986.1 hypothetical protein F444_21766 [Phytophthora nicotianae P1976]ETP01086.1 hypothetical protein F441_21625 [Phytophthora nicotianae CJ01A1]ETP29231.1 hypothetical protein F442_21599 [Phytophthora nicotianae P10297]